MNCQSGKSNRVIGIDALRCISMFMIITLHYLANGGALYNTQLFSINYYVAWLLEAFCYVAVNCYILISAYFLINAEFDLKKIVNLWSKVFFYSVAIYITLSLFGFINFNKYEFIKSCFPILLSKYWFATCYIGLYILFPYINILIKSINKKQLEHLLFILIILFSAWKTIIPFAYTLNPGGGSNIVWFIVLYFLGAYIKLYQDEYNSKFFILWYILLVCFIALSKFIFQFIFLYFEINKINGAVFYHYDSLPMLIASLMLFMYFKNFNIKNIILIKAIKIISPLVFSIYLIHNNQYLNQVLWINLLHVDALFYSPYFLFVSLILVFCIYIICCTIEYIRLRLCRIFKIDKLENILIARFKKYWDIWK